MSAVPAIPQKTICVLGLGYTGLPTAAVLASRGYKVRGVEIKRDAVEKINAGRAHIVEPELDMLVRAAVQTGNLQAFQEPAQADVFLLCVPTPCTPDKQPDLQHVLAAASSICPFLRAANLVVLESTSPPGTTDRLAEMFRREASLSSEELLVAHAPERVLPGRILREVVENDRIIGGVDERSTEQCAEFYRTFVSGELHLTNARTAETAKLLENAYRDVNIAFANEVSMLADELDLDVWELIELANRHPRVKILQPGPGVGGHCIPVDPWFLASSVPDATPLIRAARRVNDGKPRWVIDRILRRAARFKDPTIACLGLSYKPNVDDLRESPAVGKVHVVEPYLERHAEFELVSWETALEDADIVVFLVAHERFKKIPRKALEEKTLIDTCGVLRGSR
jgi:UDP-N-acetyl-D-mannosaminuronic acid dehydrogenase